MAENAQAPAMLSEDRVGMLHLAIGCAFEENDLSSASALVDALIASHRAQAQTIAAQAEEIERLGNEPATAAAEMIRLLGEAGRATERAERSEARAAELEAQVQRLTEGLKYARPFLRLHGCPTEPVDAVLTPPTTEAPLLEAGSCDFPPLVFGYTNWRGEFGVRQAVPLKIFFGTTSYHQEPQWLLEARDLDKGAVRVFAVKDMRPVATEAPAETLAGDLARALDEIWTFVYVWANAQAFDRGGKIHEKHAEILARLHATFVKAHDAGLLPNIPTSRLPILLAEQGYDIAALTTATDGGIR